ncbi:MAG: hypothetical protein AAF551_00225 [Bacteroidota bacterium]
MLKTSKAKNKTRRLSNSDLFKNKKVDESNDSIDVVDENDPSNNNLLLGYQPDKPKVNPSVVVNKQNNNNQNDSDDNSPLLNDVVDDTNNNDNNNPSENIIDDNDDANLDDLKVLPQDDVNQAYDVPLNRTLFKNEMRQGSVYYESKTYPNKSYYNWTWGDPVISKKKIKGGLSKKQEQQVDTIFQKLENEDAAYLNIMIYLHNQIGKRIGKAAVDEYYRGAHVIFKDGGKVYDDVMKLGKSIARLQKNKKNDYKVENLRATGKTANPDIDVFNGGMYKRDALDGQNETSHYNRKGFDNNKERYQIGIDLPGKVSWGHILVGIVPKGFKNAGQTFIQTEAYGFQTPTRTGLHGTGWLANKGITQQTGTQSGLVGQSPHSEKEGSASGEIVEPDN